MATNTVVVTPAYRLGAFGLLASEILRSQSSDNSTGNNALLDQRAALQWVQTNIEAFGGNKDNVMFFGESAGGCSVSLHMLMRNSRGLAKSFGVQSGAYSFWTVNLLDKAAKTAFDKVTKALGCTQSDPVQVVACLKVGVV